MDGLCKVVVANNSVSFIRPVFLMAAVLDY